LHNGEETLERGLITEEYQDCLFQPVHCFSKSEVENRWKPDLEEGDARFGRKSAMSRIALPRLD
jgi:hypothetical protein